MNTYANVFWEFQITVKARDVSGVMAYYRLAFHRASVSTPSLSPTRY